MQLQIRRLGEEMTVEVNAAQRIQFPDGIIGFEQIKEYALIADPDGGVLWLHSTTDEQIAFPVIDPFLVWPDYDITLPDADAAALRLARPQDAQILAIVTPREDPSLITANLRAPIVINQAERMARQIILPEAAYAVRTPILSALTARAQMKRSRQSTVATGPAVEPREASAQDRAAA